RCYRRAKLRTPLAIARLESRHHNAQGLLPTRQRRIRPLPIGEPSACASPCDRTNWVSVETSDAVRIEPFPEGGVQPWKGLSGNSGQSFENWHHEVERTLMSRRNLCSRKSSAREMQLRAPSYRPTVSAGGGLISLKADDGR